MSSDLLPANYFSGKIDEVSSIHDSATNLMVKNLNTESKASLKEKFDH